MKSLLILLVSLQSWAGTSSATFQVSVTILTSCLVKTTDSFIDIKCADEGYGRFSISNGATFSTTPDCKIEMSSTSLLFYYNNGYKTHRLYLCNKPLEGLTHITLEN